jgi:hypothetical protein
VTWPSARYKTQKNSDLIRHRISTCEAARGNKQIPQKGDDPENGFLTLRQDGEDLQERLWLSFDIAQIISNASNHKQIILCALCG